MRVTWVSYGSAASRALRDAVARAKGGDPLAPTTVIVPSNHVGVSARRLLASGAMGPVTGTGRGVAAVDFVTPYRLAELLGSAALAGSGRRPVSTPVLAAAFRHALAEAPGVFEPVADHPATEQALISSYKELRDLPDALLGRLAGASPRAGDVVRLCRAVRSRLAAAWYDEEDLMVAAVEALARPGTAARLGGVVVHLPQRLSLHAGRLVGALAAHLDVEVVAGCTGDERADAEVRRSVERVAPGAPAPPVGVALPVAAGATRIVTASDPEQEVRLAVRAVVDAARDGTPLDRIAVLHAGASPYGRLLHEHLAAAGIASNGTAVAPLTARVAGRFLLEAMALPAGGFRRHDVLAWLAGAPVLDHGVPAPVAAWDRVTRDAGVVAGAEQWDTLLAAYAEGRRRRAHALAADPDEPPWRAERAERQARRALRLRELVVGLAVDLRRAAETPRKWSRHAAWAQGLLDRFLGDAAARADWPADERRAAERVERALHRLAALDDVEGPVTLDVFQRTVELELDGDLGRVGRFGEGVLVGPVGMGVGLDLELAVVLGLAEGSFPAGVHDDSLLPDHERERAGGALALRRERTERQHRELLATLTSARSHHLSMPRGDLRQSRETVPSRWLLQLAGALTGTALDGDGFTRAAAPWLDHDPSFAAGLRAVAFPATEQEHRLRRLLAVADTGGPALAVAGDDTARRAGAVIEARRSPAFTRFDGNLAGLRVPSPVGHPTSPTRLERWASCPFAYFLQDVLRVEPLEDPERELSITALDRGSLVHTVLERLVLEQLDGGTVPEPDHRWDRARLAAIAAEVCDAYEAEGRTGRPIFWRRERRRILRDLDRFVTEDDERRRLLGARPVAAELAFAVDGSTVGPVELTLPDGRVVRVRGKADRVDLGDDGRLHVVDYKTGSARSYQGLSEDDPDKCGTRLQLVVYGEAARLQQGTPHAPVHASYWFVTAKGNFQLVGYPVTDAVRDRVAGTLGTIVAGIEAGLFPARPTAGSTNPWVDCWYCDPDGLGAADLRRQWEAKRADPAVLPYTLLAEPDALAPAAADDGEHDHG